MIDQLRAFLHLLAQQPWSLYWLQARRVARIEVRRNLLSWKAAWIYFLAFCPTVILLIHTLFARHPQYQIGEDTQVLAAIVQFYYLRLGIFFGCLGIF